MPEENATDQKADGDHPGDNGEGQKKEHLYRGVCGADVTEWFLKEIALHMRYALATRDFHFKLLNAPNGNIDQAVGGLLGSFVAQSLKMTNADHFWSSDRSCPTEDANFCHEGATLCGICIHQSQLWNMLYGIVGKVLFGEGILTLAGTLEASAQGNWGDDPEDQAAYRIGFHIFDSLNLVASKLGDSISLTEEDFCRIFHEGVTANPEFLLVKERLNPGNRINVTETCRPCTIVFDGPHTLSDQEVQNHEDFVKNFKTPDQIILDKILEWLKKL